jgi:hypothetical protein
MPGGAEKLRCCGCWEGLLLLPVLLMTPPMLMQPAHENQTSKAAKMNHERTEFTSHSNPPGQQ